VEGRVPMQRCIGLISDGKTVSCQRKEVGITLEKQSNFRKYLQ
jgi:hypothetical protein